MDDDQSVFTVRTIFLVLGGLSTISLSVVIISLVTNPKLQHHPAKLIAMICVIEAMLVWNALIQTP